MAKEYMYDKKGKKVDIGKKYSLGEVPLDFDVWVDEETRVLVQDGNAFVMDMREKEGYAHLPDVKCDENMSLNQCKAAIQRSKFL